MKERTGDTMEQSGALCRVWREGLYAGRFLRVILLLILLCMAVAYTEQAEYRWYMADGRERMETEAFPDAAAGLTAGIPAAAAGSLAEDGFSMVTGLRGTPGFLPEEEAGTGRSGTAGSGSGERVSAKDEDIHAGSSNILAGGGAHVGNDILAGGVHAGSDAIPGGVHTGNDAILGGVTGADEIPGGNQISGGMTGGVTDGVTGGAGSGEEMAPGEETMPGEDAGAGTDGETDGVGLPADPSVPGGTGEGAAPGAIGGFLVDESGIIYGIADAAQVVTEGYVAIPTEGCRGIAAGTFASGLPEAREIFIPGNITSIEEGAFVGLGNMEWYEADPSGGYSSEEGVLFSENGTCILAFPAGRTGTYKVPSRVVRFASGAFAGASIQSVDATNCALTDVGDIPSGIEVVTR